MLILLPKFPTLNSHIQPIMLGLCPIMPVMQKVMPAYSAWPWLLASLEASCVLVLSTLDMAGNFALFCATWAGP
jgi:hypothetical protein